MSSTIVGGSRMMVRADVPMMPAMLAPAGYATALFGKWHLGENHPHRPQDRTSSSVKPTRGCAASTGTGLSACSAPASARRCASSSPPLASPRRTYIYSAKAARKTASTSRPPPFIQRSAK